MECTSPPPTMPRKLSISKLPTKAPKFVRPLEGRMADEGDSNVELKCIIDGMRDFMLLITFLTCSFSKIVKIHIIANPSPECRWTKNNSMEPLSAKDANISTRFDEVSGEACLTIKNVSIADGGRYTCTAENEHGVASSLADFVVKSKLCHIYDLNDINFCFW